MEASTVTRTTLPILDAVATLTESLREELAITAVVIVLFLLHIRASIIVAVTLPMAVFMAFIGMQWFQIDANIMSLAGIAIATLYIAWEQIAGRDRLGSGWLLPLALLVIIAALVVTLAGMLGFFRYKRWL